MSTIYELSSLEGLYTQSVCTLSTSTSDANPIMSLALLANSSNNLSFNISAKATSGICVFSGIVGVNQGNAGASPIVSDILNNVALVPLELLGTSISFSTSANTVTINANGLLSNNIDWGCLITLLSVV